MGAGSHLHDLIVTFTGEKPKLSCGCGAFIRKMDKNLPWAKKNVEIIAQKLRREAQQRKWWGKLTLIPGTTTPIRWLVQEAIRRAEADLVPT